MVIPPDQAPRAGRPAQSPRDYLPPRHDRDARRRLKAGLITAVYQRELSDALKECGFTVHPQGSLYHTDAEQAPITAVMRL
jgi:hypothetical protein